MKEPTENQDKLAKAVINAGFIVHQELGPGLLESVYEECLACVLEDERISYERQKAVPVKFRNRKMEIGFRADFIIENQLIIELKTVESLLPVHKAQLLTYMKLCHINLGLLMNFNAPLFKNGVKRMILSQ